VSETPSVSPARTGQRISATVPAPCTAAQLTALPAGLSIAAGYADYALVVTNISRVTCTLYGPRYLASVEHDGTRLIMESGRVLVHHGDGLVGPPVTLRPGQSAETALVGLASPTCAHGTGDLVLVLAIGLIPAGELRISYPSLGAPFFATCGSASAGILGFGAPSLRTTPR
jgi:hypothetical protein